MDFTPHAPEDRVAMLATLGMTSIEQLFEDIPEKVRFPALDKLPEPVSELEIAQELKALSETNAGAHNMAMFLGAGVYNHFSPSFIHQLLLRGELLTAYTPYQPEVSQGTLQIVYEYQSMICQLTGMEVANASHYDGATAMAEAVIMAFNVQRGKRHKVVWAPTIHPQYREVARTYTHNLGIDYVGDDRDQMLSVEQLLELVDKDTALVILQYPNFLGGIDSLDGVADAVHAKGALLAVVANPMALGLLRPPGDFGADIVLGEAQPLGIPMSYGGPYLGYFATREKYVRKIAGRLVGETIDANGKRGFVLTLSTREQHIRREKATSNICTNQGLMATAATMYMAAMGKTGMRQVAELNYHRAHYAADRIDAIDGYEVIRDQPFFNEFMVRCPMPVSEINDELFEHFEIIGGYDLEGDYPHLKHVMLLAVTEMNDRDQIDELVDALTDIAGGHDHV